MEGLAAASSVAGVIQLADSVKKLYEFWDSIKDVPEDTRAIALDLRLLLGVLAEISSDAQHVELDHTLEAVMEACLLKSKALNALISGMESSFVSSSSLARKWALLKGVLKTKKISKFRDSLEELKITLMLARQTQNDRLSRQTLFAIRQANSTLSTNNTPILALSASASISAHQRPVNGLYEGDVHTKECTQGFVNQPSAVWKPKNASLTSSNYSLDQNCLEEASIANPSSWIRLSTYRHSRLMEYFFGSIRIMSRTDLLEANYADAQLSFDQEDQREEQLTFTISLATWLTKFGLSQGFHVRLSNSSIRGWKFALDTFRAVPDDSLIFEYCRAGDLDAVKLLLSTGQASVKDTDSSGRTALYVAAENFHPELCKILVNAGADKTIRDYASWSILLAAADNLNGTIKQIQSISASETFKVRCIDTLRILNECIVFSDNDFSGWMLLYILALKLDLPTSYARSIMSTIVLWVLSRYSDDIRTNFDESCYRTVLACIDFTLSQDVGRSFLRLGPDHAIDARFRPGGYSKLLFEIASAGDLSGFLGLGPNIYLLGSDKRFSPYEESATSLAMYSCEALANWRTYLKRSEVDICEFIVCELEQGPLVERGWDFDALRRLFYWDFEQEYDFSQCFCCRDCNFRSPYHLRIQPYWLQQLDKIKQGIDVHDPPTVGIGADQGSIAGIGDSQLRRSNETSEVCNTMAQDGDNQLPANPTSNDLPTQGETIESASELSTTSITSEECRYGRDELVCMHCWLHYQRTGRLYERPPEIRWGVESPREKESSYTNNSEDDYSPFHIHS